MMAFERIVVELKGVMKPHFVFVVCIISLSTFGLYQGTYLGLASFHNYSVMNMLKRWQTSPLEHSYQEYFSIKEKAQQVVLYHPSNAEYWDLKAQVSEWGVIFGYEKHENALSEAENSYLRATELRPLWPESWASLVKLKWRLQEFDEQMLHYFQRATELGPQKLKVHIIVVELGLALYAGNHPMLLNIRPEFYNRIARGLKHGKTRNRVRTLISEHKLEALVCSWLKNEELSTRELIPKCS